MSGNPEVPTIFDPTAQLLPAGSRIVVVGGNGGIGASLCIHARRAGVSVVSLDTAAAITENSLPSDIGVISIDALQPNTIVDALSKAAIQLHGLDGLVYLSGISPPPKPAAETSLDEWDQVMSINLRGAFVAARAAAPLMSQSGGALVFVSSGLAAHVEPGFSAYSASKAGLIALAKVLAKELAPAIRVNVVAPGLVQTPFLSGGTGRAKLSKGWFDNPEQLASIQKSILLGRVAIPDDIVGPILFLLGDASRYMTGQTLYVNAGRYLP